MLISAKTVVLVMKGMNMTMNIVRTFVNITMYPQHNNNIRI
jgi:hypothetical protein